MAAPVDYQSPRFHLEVEEERLPAAVARLVLEVELEFSVELADCLTLHVANPVLENARGARAVTDSPVFRQGARVDLYMAYGSTWVYMGRTYVGKWFPDFPRAGMPTLKVKCYDFRMNMARHFRHSGYTYTGKTDAELATHVATAHWGLTPQVTATGTRKRTRPHRRGSNDLVFMNRLAKLNNYEFFTYHVLGEKTDRLYFGPRTDPSHPYAALLPTQQYVYGRPPGTDGQPLMNSLLQFQPSWAVHGQSSKVTVSYFDRSSGKSVNLDVTALNGPPVAEYKGASKYSPILSEYRYGTEITLSAFGETEELVSDKPFNSKDDARLYAERWFLQRMEGFIVGHAFLPGDPRLRPKQQHTFQNLGNRFTGDYYLTRVRHRMTRGGIYECDLHARKRSLDQPDTATASDDGGDGE